MDIIRECKKKTMAKPQPIELERGFATIPLKGIDGKATTLYLDDIMLTNVPSSFPQHFPPVWCQAVPILLVEEDQQNEHRSRQARGKIYPQRHCEAFCFDKRVFHRGHGAHRQSQDCEDPRGLGQVRERDWRPETELRCMSILLQREKRCWVAEFR